MESRFPLTNTQLWLAVGIPSFLVILSWITNNSRQNRIEDKLDAMRKEMFDEFKQFYRTLGQHDAEIQNLKTTKAGTQ